MLLLVTILGKGTLTVDRTILVLLIAAAYVGLQNDRSDRLIRLGLKRRSTANTRVLVSQLRSLAPFP